jgi:hypothetical protein
MDSAVTIAVPARVGVTFAGRVWTMLFARIGLAIAFQAAATLVAMALGSADPLRAAADWWLGWFALANVATLALLRTSLHSEGARLRDLYRTSFGELRRDAGWIVAALVVSGPVGFLPNLLLGQALWGSAQVGADLSFRPLPVAGALAILAIFPLVQGAAELPTYFGYAMPRLERLYGWRVRALLLAAVVLSLQHVFLPFLLDARFIVWRALMFLPFACWIGFILYKRPRLLPVMAVMHGLIDASLPVVVLAASL